MNKQPSKLGTQRLHIYTDVDGGGCIDVGVVQMIPGAALYHQQSIEDMRLAERVGYIPYMLSVLAVLGHQPSGE